MSKSTDAIKEAFDHHEKFNRTLLAKKINVSTSFVHRIVKMLLIEKYGDNYHDHKMAGGRPTDKEVGGRGPDVTRPSEAKVEFGDVNGTVQTSSFTIKTAEDACAYAEVDMDVWEIERKIINFWDVTMKIKKISASGKEIEVPVTRRNYQIKVWLRRQVREKVEEAMERLVNRISKFKYAKFTPTHFRSKSGYAAEVAPLDAHLGKLAWSAETQQRDYDLPIGVADYGYACTQNLEWISPFSPEKIFYILGQDLMHAENLEGVFNYEVENVAFDEETVLEHSSIRAGATEKPEDLQLRSPVVTIMGHVDHGKTSLLDAIRTTNVTEGEAGGITQHIGAYEVELDGKKISFLDTPGHEAFTAMRARGAKVTDIVVLVVAADDGVMPQTKEAINHAKAAGVPIIVAINKMDKPDANPDRVKQELTEFQMLPEEWGGDTIFVEVSAKARTNLDQLLEMILLQAEVMDLKANPNKRAKGAIVEARIDKGRGPVATVLVQEGTLRIGDPIVTGVHFGRVRTMIDDRGGRVEAAGPSCPVEVTGLSGVPDAGDSFHSVEDDKTAKDVAQHRAQKIRETELAKTSKISLEQLYARIKEGDVKELKVIIKGDVQGSVEAVKDSLLKLATDACRLVVIHTAVGGIIESDITLASASDAIVLGFNVRPEPKAMALAEAEGVDIRLYNIIYDAVADIKDAMEGLLAPTLREKHLGRAEVRETFSVTKVGTIAGSYVVDGKIVRGAGVRLVRDNVVVWEGKMSSLKRFKDDVKEVATGYECGIGLENYNDLKVGDIIEAFEMESIKTTL